MAYSFYLGSGFGNSKTAPGAPALAAFLRRCRTRIAPNVTRLGPYFRLPKRIGKSVTQEEVAEAIGVTRTWYGKLETRAEVRPSLPLLSRLAVVLMLTSRERSRLLNLAMQTNTLQT